MEIAFLVLGFLVILTWVFLAQSIRLRCRDLEHKLDIVIGELKRK